MGKQIAEYSLAAVVAIALGELVKFILKAVPPNMTSFDASDVNLAVAVAVGFAAIAPLSKTVADKIVK